MVAISARIPRRAGLVRRSAGADLQVVLVGCCSYGYQEQDRDAGPHINTSPKSAKDNEVDLPAESLELI